MNLKKTFLILIGLSIGLVGCQEGLTVNNDFAQKAGNEAGQQPGGDIPKIPGVDVGESEEQTKLTDIIANSANDILTDLNNDADLNTNLANLLFGDKIDRVKDKISNFFDKITSKLVEAKAKVDKVKTKIQSNIDKLDPNESNQLKVIKKLQALQAKLDKVNAKIDKVIAKLGLALDKIDTKIDSVIAKIDDSKWYNLILIYQLTKMKDKFLGPLFDRLSNI